MPALPLALPAARARSQPLDTWVAEALQVCDTRTLQHVDTAA